MRTGFTALVVCLACALWCGWRLMVPSTPQRVQTKRPSPPPPARSLQRALPSRLRAKSAADTLGSAYRSPLAGSGVSSDPAPYKVRAARAPRRLRGYSFGKAKYALVVSIDGVSYDAMRRYGADLPLFRGLIKRGFLRPTLTVFPSVTWNAHASIATGQYARHHGILGNRWLENFKALIYPFQADITEYERSRRTPSLYDLAYKRGWPTATINWPSTQYARHVTYNMPEIMYTNSLTYRYLSPPVKKLLAKKFFRTHRDRSLWPAGFFRRFLGRLAASEKIETDMLVRDIAVGIVGPKKNPPSKAKIPRLMLLHFLTPDSWLHKYGPSPWVLRWSLEQMEQMIKKVIDAYKRAGIWKQTAFFLTSDHGFSTATHTMGIRQLLIREGISRYRKMSPRYRRREQAMTFLNGHAAFIYVRPKKQSELLPKIIRVLRDPKWRSCIEGVYTPEEFKKMGLPVPDTSGRKSLRSYRDRSKPGPVAGRHQGAPQLIALSTSSCIFVRYHSRSRKIIKEIKNPWQRFGVHGYLPTKREFWAFTIGHGPGIRARKRISRRSYSVDIAPTVAHLLGLRWPKRWAGFRGKRFKLDGRILRDVLKR